MEGENIKALKNALSGELAVIEMYRNALPRIQSQEAKEALQQLISESEVHAAKVRELLAEGVPTTTEPFRTDELTKFLDAGISEEQGMEELYRELAEKTDDAVERSVLVGIANDERRHRDLLKKVSRAIMDEQG